MCFRLGSIDTRNVSQPLRGDLHRIQQQMEMRVAHSIEKREFESIAMLDRVLSSALSGKHGMHVDRVFVDSIVEKYVDVCVTLNKKLM